MADSGDSDAQQAAAAQAVMEVSAFANYLRRVVPVLLEDVEDTPAALVTAFKERASIESMKKFISDPQVSVLLIQRLGVKGKFLFKFDISIGRLSCHPQLNCQNVFLDLSSQCRPNINNNPTMSVKKSAFPPLFLIASLIEIDKQDLLNI